MKMCRYKSRFKCLPMEMYKLSDAINMHISILKYLGDFAQSDSSTSETRTVFCVIPKLKRFTLIRNSGRKKNSGISSLKFSVISTAAWSQEWATEENRRSCKVDLSKLLKNTGYIEVSFLEISVILTERIKPNQEIHNSRAIAVGLSP